MHHPHAAQIVGTLVVVLLGTLPLGEVGAQGLAHGAIGVRNWTVDDGLPQGSITDIAQTEDGFLWLGTFGGLVRFDGVTLETQSGAPTENGVNFRVTALVADGAGTLWVGLQSGGIARYDRGVWSRPPQPPSVQVTTVWDLTMGPQGPVAATYEGVVAWRMNRFQLLDGLDPPQRSGASGILGAHGSVFVAAGDGLSRVRGDALELLHPNEGGVSAIATGPLGGLWMASDGWLGLYTSGGVFGADLLGPTGHPWALATDSAGDLWMAADSGLLRLGRADDLVARLLATREPMEPEHWSRLRGGARGLFQDRENNLWAGANGSGLYALRRDEFLRRNVAPVFGGRSVGSVLGAPDGGLYVSDGCTQIAYVRGARMVPVASLELDTTCISALAMDGRGHLWVAGGRELVELRRADGWVEVSRRRLPEGIRSIAHGDAGLWIGSTGHGLGLLDAGGEQKWFRRENGLVHDHITTLQVRGDTVYVGHTSGTSIWRPTGIVALSEADGHPPGSVRSILPDPDGTVWIGTYGGGLARWHRGTFSRFTRADGLFDDVVSLILDDGAGHLWMNGNRGVSSVSRRELADFAAGRITSIRAPSLATGEGNGYVQPTGANTQDGLLSFPTVDGLVQLRADWIRENRATPTALVEEAVVDGAPLALDAPNLLPPGDGELRVQFTSPSLRRPELVRFQYRLSRGEEGPWQSLDGRRSVHLRNLEPGEYTFAVRATNEDDVTSLPAVIQFELRPAFHQTMWFRVLLVLGLIALGFLVQSVRTRRFQQHATALRAEVEQRKHAEVRLREEGERNLELERKLAQAERMEAIGTLAGGVAHDFNNLLTVITNYSTLLRREVRPETGSSADEAISEIVRCADRAAKLTRQLLAFGRRQHLQPVTIDPAATVRELAPVLRRLGADGVEVELVLGEDAGWIHCDPTGFENALVNLVLNAAQAATDRASVTIHVEAAADEVRVVVVDRGPGIPDEVLPHIFEPFYTTKEVGKGTGLGLAGVHGFVNQSNGRISVESDAGKGARFEIVLPRVDRPSVPQEPQPAAASPPPRTVLLVDDDAPVRRSLRRLLKSKGFTAFDADSGDAALAILEREAIGVLVTDVRMPGMSGVELAQRVGSAYPQVRVLFISGHVTPSLVGQLDALGGEVLEKPFAPDALLEQVNRLLGHGETVSSRGPGADDASERQSSSTVGA